MVEPLRHRQTKGAATDMFYLTPPRHISTLPIASLSGRPLLFWFLDAGMTNPSTRCGGRRPKSAKARSRGKLGTGWQRVLWRINVGADLDDGRDASTTPPKCLHGREVGRAQQAFRRALGAGQRAIGGLVDVIGSREIAAGVEPAHRNGKAATSTEGLTHDVSVLFGVGRHLGSQPRANTSMTIMRAPQRGHGQGSTPGVSGATSGCFCGSAAGRATLRSARAVAMLSARLVGAKSP